jgi:REP element-mobilizing transposase RayT
VKIRKYHPNKSVLFVTFSLEQGLLLLANPLCEAIVKSCLARAQFKYPVKISAFIINANHVHLIIKVDNPDNVSKFMQYFKTESAHNVRGYSKEAQRLLSEAKKSHEFTLSPNAWMEGFNITDSEEQNRINQRLIQRVRTLELRSAKVRERLGKRVMGRDKLINQPLNLNYQSKRSGKKMHCLSDDIQLRVEFIDFLKDLYAEATEVLAQWRQGNIEARFPLGLYPPCMPKLAEPLGMW